MCDQAVKAARHLKLQASLPSSWQAAVHCGPLCCLARSRSGMLGWTHLLHVMLLSANSAACDAAVR